MADSLIQGMNTLALGAASDASSCPEEVPFTGGHPGPAKIPKPLKTFNVDDFYFKYFEFDSGRFSYKAPDLRKNAQKHVEWNELSFGYNHATPLGDRPGRFQFIGPESTFTRGIVPQMSKDGTKVEYYKLNYPLKIGDPEHDKIIALGEWLHASGLQLIQLYRDALNRPDFDASITMAKKLLQTPIFNPDDLPASKKIPGQGPTAYKYMRCKILNFSNEKTIVRMGTELWDWKKLLNRPFAGVPIINVSHIYVPDGGGPMTFQCKLACVIVTRGGASKVSADFGAQDADEIYQKDPDLANKIKEEFSRPIEAPTEAEVVVPPGKGPAATGNALLANSMPMLDAALLKASAQVNGLKLPAPAPAPKMPFPTFPAAAGKSTPFTPATGLHN